ncbi:MAG: hypothetical protein IK144_11850 [Bacteroidaceae bacterium]|nr:hypothetical protein [Bacteroidaceae bacterium]
MNQDEKRQYMREWYKKNAERLKAYQRAKYIATKKGVGVMDEENRECCKYCKRFSAPRIKSDTGWCMKHRRKMSKKDYCSYYLAKVKIRYEQPVHAVTVFTGE